MLQLRPISCTEKVPAQVKDTMWLKDGERVLHSPARVRVGTVTLVRRFECFSASIARQAKPRGGSNVEPSLIWGPVNEAMLDRLNIRLFGC